MTSPVDESTHPRLVGAWRWPALLALGAGFYFGGSADERNVADLRGSDAGALFGVALPDTTGREQRSANGRQGAGRQFLGDLVRAVPRGDAGVREGAAGIRRAKACNSSASPSMRPTKVRQFAAEIGLNYPALIGGYGAMELSQVARQSARWRCRSPSSSTAPGASATPSWDRSRRRNCELSSVNCFDNALNASKMHQISKCHSRSARLRRPVSRLSTGAGRQSRAALRRSGDRRMRRSCVIAGQFAQSARKLAGSHRQRRGSRRWQLDSRRAPVRATATSPAWRPGTIAGRRSDVAATSARADRRVTPWTCAS